MEKAIQKLDHCVSILQGDPLPIKDAIKEYEKGLAAAEKILDTLNHSETKIKQLNLKADALIDSCKP